MDQRLDLDYCPECDLPTFEHEMVVMIHGEYAHRHCFERSVWVAKRKNLTRLPDSP